MLLQQTPQFLDVTSVDHGHGHDRDRDRERIFGVQVYRRQQHGDFQAGGLAENPDALKVGAGCEQEPHRGDPVAAGAVPRGLPAADGGERQRGAAEAGVAGVDVGAVFDQEACPLSGMTMIARLLKCIRFTLNGPQSSSWPSGL